MAFTEQFWARMEELIAGHAVVIDRPRGSTHPRYPGMVYPVDYGYLEGTRGGDGAGVDVWLGASARRALVGVVCTVDLDKADAEVKLLLGCTPSEADLIVNLLNEGPMGALLVPRPVDRARSAA